MKVHTSHDKQYLFLRTNYLSSLILIDAVTPNLLLVLLVTFLPTHEPGFELKRVTLVAVAATREPLAVRDTIRFARFTFILHRQWVQ